VPSTIYSDAFFASGSRKNLETRGVLNAVPPHLPEAEMALLGSMLCGPEGIDTAAAIIAGPDDFYDQRHGAIFEAILQLHDNGPPIEVLTLVDHLKTRDQLDQLGGVDYLISLCESVPSAAHAEHYAGIVRNLAKLPNQDPTPAQFAAQQRNLAIGFWGMVVGLVLSAIGFVALVVLAILRLVIGSPNQPGLCPSCGYDLRASEGECPECGEAIPEATKASPTPLRRPTAADISKS